MLDLIKYFNQNSVFSKYKSFISNKFWGYNVEDNAFVIMKSKNGVISSIHSTATQWQHKFNMEITLSKGSIILEGILSGPKHMVKKLLRFFQVQSHICIKAKLQKLNIFILIKIHLGLMR